MEITFIPQPPDEDYEDVYAEGDMIGCVRYYQHTDQWIALTVDDLPIVDENGRGNAHFQTKEEAAGRLVSVFKPRKMTDSR